MAAKAATEETGAVDLAIAARGENPFLSATVRWIINDIACVRRDIGRPVCPRAAKAIAMGNIKLVWRKPVEDPHSEVGELIYFFKRQKQLDPEFSLLSVYEHLSLPLLNLMFRGNKERLLRERILLGRFHPELRKTLLDDSSVNISPSPYPVMALRTFNRDDRRFLINQYTTTEDNLRYEALINDMFP